MAPNTTTDEESSLDDTNSRKRKATEDEETDWKKMSRSERKRTREKKRREELNVGFDALTHVLVEIDPDTRNEAKSSTTGDDAMSRVDLIARATQVLRRVHSENEQRKRLLALLQQSSSNSAVDGIMAHDVSQTSSTLSSSGQEVRIPIRMRVHELCP